MAGKGAYDNYKCVHWLSATLLISCHVMEIEEMLNYPFVCVTSRENFFLPSGEQRQIYDIPKVCTSHS